MENSRKQWFNLLDTTYLLFIISIICFSYSCHNRVGQSAYRHPVKEESASRSDSKRTDEENQTNSPPPVPPMEMIEVEDAEVEISLDLSVPEEVVFEEVFTIVETQPSFPAGHGEFSTEEYDYYQENDFTNPLNMPLSTFSIDVDKASYANVRRFLNDHQMPPSGSIRIEEMINYFPYQYSEPEGVHPFSIHHELTECPWNERHQLLKIGIKGKSMRESDIKASNLVFLVDVSGSMMDKNKLPMVKKSLKILVKNLKDHDKISIVVYAGSAGLVLPATPGNQKDKILNAINKLSAGGSTAGGEGIQLAYKIASENYIPNGNNRVILATDGDFNIGVSSTSELVSMIEQKRQEDIYLTICGFGLGNYKDGRMEQISNSGNGNYFYIDDITEANRVFDTDLMANMFAIAKDVKIQIEFNPAVVGSYRLIGYENRKLEAEDFDDDLKDAGELGAGHTVTALYEIIPASIESGESPISLKYQQPTLVDSEEMATIKFRYKPLKSDESVLIDESINPNLISFDKCSQDTRLASAVTAFGLVLRESKYKGKSTFQLATQLAEQVNGKEYDEYRFELLSLIEKARLLLENQ